MPQTQNSLPTKIATMRSVAPDGAITLAALTLVLWSFTRIQGMLSVYRSDLQEYFGLSIKQFGFLMSIGAVPGIVGSLLGGYLTDRIGSRPVLRVCMIGTAVGMGLIAMAQSKVFIFVAVCFFSLFAPALSIATHAFLIRLFPNRRRRVLSLGMVTIALIGGSFSLLAEELVQWHRSSQAISFSTVLHWPFAVGAVILALGAILYTPRGPAAKVAGTHAPPSGNEKGHLSAQSLLLVLCLVLHVVCDVSANRWMPKVLDSPAYARVVFHPGRVLFAFMVAYVVARSLLSILPEKRGRWLLMIAPSIIGSAVFTTGILTRDQAWTSICYVLGGFFWAVEYPVVMAMLAERAGKRFASAVAIQWVCLGAGTFGMISLMGAIGERLGEAELWKILLIPSCCLPLVGVMGAIWVWKFGRADTSSSPQPTSKD